MIERNDRLVRADELLQAKLHLGYLFEEWKRTLTSAEVRGLGTTMLTVVAEMQGAVAEALNQCQASRVEGVVLSDLKMRLASLVVVPYARTRVIDGLVKLGCEYPFLNLDSEDYVAFLMKRAHEVLDLEFFSSEAFVFLASTINVNGENVVRDAYRVARLEKKLLAKAKTLEHKGEKEASETMSHYAPFVYLLYFCMSDIAALERIVDTSVESGSCLGLERIANFVRWYGDVAFGVEYFKEYEAYSVDMFGQALPIFLVDSDVQIHVGDEEFDIFDAFAEFEFNGRRGAEIFINIDGVSGTPFDLGRVARLARPSVPPEVAVNILNRFKHETSTAEDRTFGSMECAVAFSMLAPSMIVASEMERSEFAELVKKMWKEMRAGRYSQESFYPVLRYSLAQILYDDDPYLDLRIRDIRDSSIRELLSNFVRFTMGLQAASDGDRPILRMIDAEKIDSPVAVKKHFANASVGPVRKYLSDAAQAYMAIETDFDRQLEFAIDETCGALGVEKEKVGVYFYQSATVAIQEVMKNYFPDLDEGDNVVASDQEYPSVLQACSGDGKAEVRTSPIFFTARSLDELMEALDELVDENTKVFVLSSVTRYGPLPCIFDDLEGDDGFNFDVHAGLKLFVARFREKYPWVTIVGDGCQASGRMIERAWGDIYLSSAKKSLGAGDAGLVVVNDSLLAKTGREERFNYNPSSLPMKYILAMAMGMRAMNSPHDLMRLEGNFGDLQRLELAEKVRRRMVILTKHLIAQLKACGHCKIVHPSHDKEDYYSGIVTFVCDELNGRYVRDRLLAEKGFLTAARMGGEAVRISFNYLHETEDTDALLMAMEEIYQDSVADAS